MEIKFSVSQPTVPVAKRLTQDDVFGVYDHDKKERTSDGMIVASLMKDFPDICPIFGDELPYKSLTVVCALIQEEDVTYWLEYVKGANCVSKRKLLPNMRVALRADYMCW